MGFPEYPTKGEAVDNPTYDEAIYMVRIKRRRAKAAMSAIVERYGVIRHDPAPGLEVLLDYFVNMVYGLELLLKVLARDWDTPGSTYRHQVGKMYEAVFARPYPDPAFMKELEDAIFDQKFLCEPARGLMDRVEAIEALWDELKAGHSRRSWGKSSDVNIEIRTGSAFGRYLLRNVERFTPRPVHRQNHMPTAHKIAMKRAQVEHLNRQIARLEAEGEPEVPIPELIARLRQDYRDKVEELASTMAIQFELWKTSEIEFSINAGWMSSADMG
jgi:hypothetical protein